MPNENALWQTDSEWRIGQGTCVVKDLNLLTGRDNNPSEFSMGTLLPLAIMQEIISFLYHVTYMHYH